MNINYRHYLFTACLALSGGALADDMKPEDLIQSPVDRLYKDKIELGDAKDVAMVPVPAGDFIMGSDREDTEKIQEQYGMSRPVFVDENPQRKMHLDAYMIDTYEVSNVQFKEFILKTKRLLPYDWGHNGY